MIKRSVAAGAAALALLTGSGLGTTTTPTTGSPVVLASQVSPLLDSPPLPGAVADGVQQFLERNTSLRSDLIGTAGSIVDQVLCFVFGCCKGQRNSDSHG
jgi:hypothetical protein